jgi:glycerophosphoryl diester phosphodiesterase
MDPQKPIVIAHRGASGYLPEHTLAAYAIAILQGADFIEPDLVMTRDGHLIARHDNRLDLTTDVATHAAFASRHTTKTVDGITMSGWFSEDFTLAEIKRLRATERIPDVRPANARFDGQFEIPTLTEIIDLAQCAERVGGRRIGLYPETKHPTYFARIGLAMEERLVMALRDKGYTKRRDAVHIQSFEIANLRRLRDMTELRLVQLLDFEGKPYDVEATGGSIEYRHMATGEGLGEIARYADAVGPDKRLIRPPGAKLDTASATDFVANAHAAGLAVHPYTFRAENRFLPSEARRGALPEDLGDSAAEIMVFLAAGVDGFFTDHPDIGVRARDLFLSRFRA